MSLHGKTALVTGGARGIGFATVQRLLREGARCVIWDRDQAAIDAATANLADAGEVTSDTVELAKPESVEAAAGQALGRHGQIDILVNNAGIAGINKKLWECTPQEWRDVMEIDLLRRVPLLPRVRAGDARGRAGAASSTSPRSPARRATRRRPITARPRPGSSALTKSLGKELADTNIRVNCITPAVIETEILKQCTQAHIDYMVSKIPMGRVGQAG